MNYLFLIIESLFDSIIAFLFYIFISFINEFRSSFLIKIYFFKTLAFFHVDSFANLNLGKKKFKKPFLFNEIFLFYAHSSQWLKKIDENLANYLRDWPAMWGSWTEYAVLWKTSFRFIWDILNFLKICKSWVWAQIRRSKLLLWWWIC